ncbi:MAG: D-glycero-alpha-D-manno-heptose-1,7-bisphosphate 7-phosphatase [Planctomycetota bacterium]|jgi:D-glycero-D-manno-heptose 1,7-bisphosphate phosphatase
MPAIDFIAIDRDGTIIENKNYLKDPDEIEFCEGAIEGLKALMALGLPTVMITNQSGIGRSYFTTEEMNAVHERLLAHLAEHGVSFQGIYICPHTPDDACNCRKPATGMLEEAAKALGSSAKRSVMIGDNRCDLELAKAAGCFGIMVRTGYGAELEAEGFDQADRVVDTLVEAATTIKERMT